MQPQDRTILYLEDEIIIALDTAQTLEEIGFRTIHMAHNLRRARAMARSVDPVPDCALLDVNISGEGVSLELGAELAADGVLVLFASGYNRREMEEEHAGLTFVEKPLNAAAILEGFARALAAQGQSAAAPPPSRSGA